jgi:site-specific DNA-methyltransferase (adenine-specific)
MINNFKNKILEGDALELFKKIPDNSIDLVLTDPPYFLDKLDSNWDLEEVNSKKNMKVITSLPAGMKFSREQGVNLYNWYSMIAKEVHRVLKPGGYFFTFSSPRLYHRIASAVDDAGFEIRDAFLWLYTQSQAKAMALDHVIKKRKDLSDEQKEALSNKLDGWKTPQLKSNYEPIVFGRKKTEGNNLDNVLKYEVGLLNTNVTTGDDMFPSNVISTDPISDDIDRAFLISKPSKKEKGEYNFHKTVKPIEICVHLIRLSVLSEDAIVLDPFMGSGTTAVATKILGLNYLGFEINKEYIEIANKRLDELKMK